MSTEDYKGTGAYMPLAVRVTFVAAGSETTKRKRIKLLADGTYIVIDAVLNQDLPESIRARLPKT